MADPIISIDQCADYVGEQTITGNGASQNATIPTGANYIQIMAEGGDVYASVNGAGTVTSGFHIPQNNSRMIGPYRNITSLGVYASGTAIKAHLVYDRF